MDAEAEATLWYFAYGSNLHAGTFLGWRRMCPRETLVAVLEGFELRFDLPVGPGERGVANVAPRPGERVWGAAYRLTLEEAAHLDRTEGIPHGAYRRLEVEVRTPAGATLSAFTYHAFRGVAGRKPSARYLGLLLEGARQLGLPPDYIERLSRLSVALDERETEEPRA